jgi:5'-nucleotidase
MSYLLKDKLVVAISSRALFDLEKENQIYLDQGLSAYTDHQIQHEEEFLKPGTAYSLVQALLDLNHMGQKAQVEVIILSRNSPSTGLRVFNSIEEKELNIRRAAFTGGEKISQYLDALKVDLFLSKNKEDVQDAIDAGFAAALLYDTPENYQPDESQIRIAFDGDAVIFSGESEEIYKAEGLEAFIENEKKLVDSPLSEGPFAKFLLTLSKIKKEEPERIRIALVTSRNSPAHKRAILTLRKWGVDVDEAFFLGGVKKTDVLKAFNAHIFFDDQDVHLESASEEVPSGRVPYPSGSKLSEEV